MKEERKKGRCAFLRDDKLIVEDRELDLKFYKKNLGNQRSEDFGDCQGGERGETATIAEGQKWNYTREGTQKSDDVSNKNVQVIASRFNRKPNKERGHMSQECQSSKVVNVCQQPVTE